MQIKPVISEKKTKLILVKNDLLKLCINMKNRLYQCYDRIQKLHE